MLKEIEKTGRVAKICCISLKCSFLLVLQKMFEAGPLLQMSLSVFVKAKERQ